MAKTKMITGKGIPQGITSLEMVKETGTLTADEARTLATMVVNKIGDEESELAILLLLCNAIAHSDDPGNLMIGIEEAIIPSMKSAIVAAQRDMCSHISELRADK